MNDKIKQAKELKNLHKDFLILIKDIEAYIPTSSDELYEQVNQLEKYHNSITTIKKELEYLYLDIGSEKIFNELLCCAKAHSLINKFFDD